MQDQKVCMRLKICSAYYPYLILRISLCLFLYILMRLRLRVLEQSSLSSIGIRRLYLRLPSTYLPVNLLSAGRLTTLLR